MALKTKVSLTINGDNIQYDCYTKIAFISGDKAEIQLKIENRKYSMQNIIINTDIETFIPNISDESSNFIKQGYEYLKTLDKYKDAVDLLDEGQTV